jgi:hypothetical protein
MEAFRYPHVEVHPQDKGVDQMRKRLAIAYFIGCALCSVNAYSQASIQSPTKLTALKAQYEKLAARYEEKCKSDKYETDIRLLQIQQGAGLAGGTIFPMTMYIVDVLRSLEKQDADDICDRATDYADIARAIGDIPDEENAKSR